MVRFPKRVELLSSSLWASTFPLSRSFPLDRIFCDLFSRENSSQRGNNFIRRVGKASGEAWVRFLSIVFSAHSTQSSYTFLFWSIMTEKRLPRIPIPFPRSPSDEAQKHRIFRDICFRFCYSSLRKGVTSLEKAFWDACRCCDSAPVRGLLRIGFAIFGQLQWQYRCSIGSSPN